MIVSVGFWQPIETKHEASMTNRFFRSCDWQNWFSTEVFGSAPMRGDAHLVDAIAGDRGPHIRYHVGGARRVEHLRRGCGHVLHHRELVVAPRHLHAEYGDSEGVHHP